MRLVHQRFLGRHEVGLVVVVAEAVGHRAQRLEGLRVGPFLQRIHPPWGERYGDIHAAILRGLLDGRTAGQHDQVGHGNLLATGGRAVEVTLYLAELLQYLRQQRRVVDFPVLLRSEANARAIGSATLVRTAVGRRRGPGHRHQVRYGKAQAEDLLLERRDVGVIDHRVVALGNRVLPDQLLLRHQRAEISRDGAHVAVGQFEPGAGEGVREFVRVLEEVARDRLVDRVETQRQIGRQHCRLAFLVRVEGIGNDFRGILGHPLVRTGRALGEFPFEIEQVLEEVVRPFDRRLAPDDFQPRCDGVRSDAGLELAAPAQPLIFDQRAFRLRPDE